MLSIAGNIARVRAVPTRNHSAYRFLVRTSGLSGVGKVAFAFLWLLVFAIPWQNALMVPGVGTIGQFIGLLAGVVSILAIMERARVSIPTAGHVLITLFVLWAAASYLWTLNPEATLLAAVSSLQLLAMVWLIWEFAPGEREQMRLMQAYVLGTYVVGTDTLYRYFFRLEFQPTDRYTSTGLNPNDLALVMCLSIPVSYYLAIQSKGLMAWVYRAHLVLAGTTILLTGSRTGFLASLMALAIVPLTFARLTRLQRIATVLTLGALVCSGLLYVPAASWERLSTTSEELTGGTLDDRTVIWQAGWEVLRAHPFRGVGAGAFGDSVGHTLSKQFVAHNTFLSILVEEGMIGFGLFFGLIVFLALCALEMPAVTRKLWIVILGTWAIGAYGATWELQKSTWFFFGLLIAQWASIVQGRPTASRVSCFGEHRLRLLPESRP
jgi:O-antigen ligase